MSSVLSTSESVAVTVRMNLFGVLVLAFICVFSNFWPNEGTDVSTCLLDNCREHRVSPISQWTHCYSHSSMVDAPADFEKK